MEQNLDKPSFGTFSIENTMEMGMGNQELLQDLISPETSTASPTDVKPIDEEEPPTPPASKKPSDKNSSQQSSGKSKNEDEGDDDEGKKNLQNFLSGDDEEEEEEDDDPSKGKTPVKKPEEQENEDEPSDEGSKFSALAKDLFKLGVFNKDEDDDEEVSISTPEEFLERFTLEKKKGAIEIVNNFIGQFGEDYQQAFDAIFVKGVNPKEYFSSYNNVVSFSEMDLSVEKNQETVIRKALEDQGFEEEDIETEVERLKNYGDLETVAARHHKVLVKKEAAKLQEMEKKAELEMQQKQAIKQMYYNNVNTVLQEKLKAKEFDGIPINPKLASEIQEFLLVEKYKTASGETLTDFDKTILELKRPENHQMKVKVALLLKVLEKDPTLSTIQKKGVSKQSNELFSEVVRHKEKGKSSSPQVKQSSWQL
jgi:hypothetical protein